MVSAASATQAAGPMSVRHSGSRNWNRPWLRADPRLQHLSQERHGDPALRRERRAVQPVQQRDECAQVAVGAREQPVQRRVLQHQATPLCAVARRVLFRGRGCPVAAELFATTLDVHLLTGGLPEDASDTDTADGRPATKSCAGVSMAV